MIIPERESPIARVTRSENPPEQESPGARVPQSERPPGARAPRSESLGARAPGARVPWSESPLERESPGARVPWSESPPALGVLGSKGTGGLFWRKKFWKKNFKKKVWKKKVWKKKFLNHCSTDLMQKNNIFGERKKNYHRLVLARTPLLRGRKNILEITSLQIWYHSAQFVV